MAIVVNLDAMPARREMRAKDSAVAIGITAQNLSVLHSEHSDSRTTENTVMSVTVAPPWSRKLNSAQIPLLL